MSFSRHRCARHPAATNRTHTHNKSNSKLHANRAYILKIHLKCNQYYDGRGTAQLRKRRRVGWTCSGNARLFNSNSALRRDKLSSRAAFGPRALRPATAGARVRPHGPRSTFFSNICGERKRTSCSCFTFDAELF